MALKSRPRNEAGSRLGRYVVTNYDGGESVRAFVFPCYSMRKSRNRVH